MPGVSPGPQGIQQQGQADGKEDTEGELGPMQPFDRGPDLVEEWEHENDPVENGKEPAEGQQYPQYKHSRPEQGIDTEISQGDARESQFR